jgi:hypothetical protein
MGLHYCHYFGRHISHLTCDGMRKRTLSFVLSGTEVSRGKKKQRVAAWAYVQMGWGIGLASALT